MSSSRISHNVFHHPPNFVSSFSFLNPIKSKLYWPFTPRCVATRWSVVDIWEATSLKKKTLILPLPEAIKCSSARGGASYPFILIAGILSSVVAWALSCCTAVNSDEQLPRCIQKTFPWSSPPPLAPTVLLPLPPVSREPWEEGMI